VDKLNPKAKCSECRKAGRSVRATFHLQGQRVVADGQQRPYRGYLCVNHDRAIRAQGGQWAARLTVDTDRLARKYTAFTSLAQLCKHRVPSLRTETAPSANDRLELRLLADAYDEHQAKRGDPRRVERC